jgi:predicted dehydrogenase
MLTSLPITGRPIRIAVVGLGQVSELCLPAYVGRDDVEVVGLCDRNPARVKRWHEVFPDAMTTGDLDDLLRVDADVVDVLVPTPAHGDVVCAALHAGFHVQVQKPLARSLEDADRMLQRARERGAMLRVLEDYLFYPPLVTLRDVVASGEIGEPLGVHMKIVASGRGGWDVDMSSYEWQWVQAQDGLGMLTFDHGWHQLAVAHWLFGPVRRIFGWVRHSRPYPDVAPDVVLDAPSTLVWEHTNDVRGVLDIIAAPDMYFRSDYYTCDERVEVTGSLGFVRCNRISSFGVQEPSVVVYRNGETRAYHALDDRPPDAFRAQADNLVGFLRGTEPQALLGADDARQILAALLAGLDSCARNAPLDVVIAPPTDS